MEPSDEQIREFWKGCGFRIQGVADFPGVVRTNYWVDSNGTPTDLPPIDLNSLFKYAVPKVSRYRLEDDWSRIAKHFAYAEMGEKSGQAWDDDPAQALFQVIWEVLHAE